MHITHIPSHKAYAHIHTYTHKCTCWTPARWPTALLDRITRRAHICVKSVARVERRFERKIRERHSALHCFWCEENWGAGDEAYTLHTCAAATSIDRHLSVAGVRVLPRDALIAHCLIRRSAKFAPIFTFHTHATLCTLIGQFGTRGHKCISFKHAADTQPREVRVRWMEWGAPCE